MASDLIYRLENVSYSYMRRFAALDDISMTVKKGDAVALLGANGSGKSTILMILAGLVFPSTGRVEFSGRELREEAFADTAFQKFFRTSVGIVFQNSDIQLFNSNVRDEIVFGLLQLDLGQDEIAARLEKYSALMDIAHLADRHPQNLSVGEKKRVALASVLAMEPEVLLFDEPTAGLDPRTCRHLIETISELHNRGYTVITATQDIHIVTEIADRAVVLSENKRIVKDGNAFNILNDKQFLETHNLVHVHAHTHLGRTHVHPHEHPSHDHQHPA